MSFDAVIMDLDGTLLLPDGSVGEKTKKVLRQLKSKEIPVFVATGRPLTGAVHVIKDLAVESIAAVYNGTQIVDWRKDETLQSFFLPEFLTRDVKKRFYDEKLDHIVYHDEVKYLKILRHHDVCHQLSEIFLNVKTLKAHEGFPQGICPRLSTFGHYEEIEELFHWVQSFSEAYVENFPFDAISAFPDSKMRYIEIQAACQGKLELLNFLKKRFGLKQERIVAFGDQTNDVKLLQAVGHGVAPSNAFSQCKEVADEIIGCHSDESVASKLEDLFL